MVSTNIQKKQFPKLYNYKNEFICELVEAINIVEEFRFGSLSTLTFEYPYYQLDAMNNVMYDANNKKIKNPKIDYIENDFLCFYNNSWYIIKIDETIRNENNAVLLKVTCHLDAYELQEKIVEYLYIQPPISVAVNATTIISEILEAGQQIRDNIVASATSNTITLDINAFPVTDYYKGFKIKIVSGVGVGQIRTITAYNHTTKQCTVDSNWTSIPTSTSVYRIYNDIWRVGTVDPVFNTVLRSHVFDYINVLEALQAAIEKYLDPSTDESGYLTYNSSFDVVSGRWIKLVNLVKPNEYNGIQFRYRKNMQSVNRQKFSNEIYTRIIPIGNDNLGVNSIATTFRTDSSVTYPDHVLGHNYIDNFQYFLGLGYTYKECVDNFTKTYKFQDDKYTVEQDLYNDCRKVLNKISLPKVIYQVTALDLSRLTGREYESFKIGDTVKIYDEELNFDVNAVISQMSVPQLNPQNTTVELTNFIENISDILRRLVNKNDGYTDIKSLYGKGSTIVIGDKLTSKNWRYADYVIREFESASTVIQTIINSINESVGGRVILLEGDYYLTSEITLKSNIILEGQGAGTRLLPKTNGINLAITADSDANISIKNLQIGVNGNLYFNNGIGIYGTSENVKIYDNLFDGVGNNVLIAINTNILEVRNNLFYNTIPTSTAIDDVIDLKGVSNAKIINNIIESNVSFRAINIETYNDYFLGEYIISGNTVKYVGGSYNTSILMMTGKVGTPYPFTLKVTDNSFYNLQNITSLGYGIWISLDNSDYPSFTNHNIDISNNKIVGAMDIGINIANDSGSVMVTNNYIDIKTYVINGICTGISVSQLSCLDNNIQHNTIRTTTNYATTYAGATYYGILDNGTNTIVGNNDLSGLGVNAITGTGIGRVLLGGNRI